MNSFPGLVECRLRRDVCSQTFRNGSEFLSSACRVFAVSVFSGDVEQVDGAEKITIRIFKSITLVHEAGMVVLEVRHRRRSRIKVCSQISFSFVICLFLSVLSGSPTRSTTCTRTPSLRWSWRSNPTPTPRNVRKQNSTLSNDEQKLWVTFDCFSSWREERSVRHGRVRGETGAHAAVSTQNLCRFQNKSL